MNSGVDKRVAAASIARPAIEGELLRRNFHDFVKAAWHIVEPGNAFSDNWHIKVICDHLEAAMRGEIQRLIINIPPRFMKSTLVSVMFPAFVWATDPTRRFLTASYAKDLATRDAVASRRLMESEWYKARWGERVKFTTDQNVKTRYENSKRGYRVTTSVDAGATGEGGDFLIVDDPINAKKAHSPTVRQEAVKWWRETMSTRYNDPNTGVAIVVMQRLAEDDLSGFLLAQEGESWEHLCLPMRYEPKRVITTKLGFTDPRTQEGELLFPGRFGEKATKRLESELGSYGTAGQLQQRPAPKEGNIFKYAGWRWYYVLPDRFDAKIISVDCTFKDKADNDFVAIQVWGSIEASFYLVQRLKQRMSFTRTLEAVLQMVAQHPDVSAVLVEDKANGSAVIDVLKERISGLVPVDPRGGKVSRAMACQADQEGGAIWLPHESIQPEILEMVEELSLFPNANHDDEVDSLTQAITWLKTRQRSTGLLTFMKAQYDAAMQQRGKAPGALTKQPIHVPAPHSHWIQ